MFFIFSTLRRFVTRFADSLAQQKIIRLEEQLETERVKNRVQEVELKELAAVIGRNFQRVQAETKQLGGLIVKTDPVGESA
jgi:hypothetical protein